jgi:phosphoribosyl 1,2-cyclic phosphate phosphodiesterase
VLVLSGLRWKPEHPTHMTIPEAVEMANELNIPQTYLIHMNSYVNHEESNKRLPDHVRLAYDQLTVELPT